jgi:serine/threonine protein kinase
MERAEKSLLDLLEEVGVLDDIAAVEVLRQVALGLKELHSLGVIHRDLSASNVLLLRTRWKLSDFGISRDVEAGTKAITYKARDIGQPRYKAPELWEGGSPSERSDLYALGCLAFEILTGHAPFLGTYEEIRQKHMLEPPPPLESTRHMAFQTLVPRLMAKDPDRRLASAQAAYTQLASIGLPPDPTIDDVLFEVKKHTDERTRADALEAAERERARRIQAGRMNSLAELEQLCEVAGVRLNQAVPELRVSWGPMLMGAADAQGGHSIV